jgi:hypothetical protein
VLALMLMLACRAVAWKAKAGLRILVDSSRLVNVVWHAISNEATGRVPTKCSTVPLSSGYHRAGLEVDQ